MGFFQDLGLDEIVSSFRDMAQAVDGLKEDIVSSVIQPGTDFKDTIQDISSTVTNGDTPDVSATK